MKSLQLVCKTFHCFVLLSTALRSLQKLQEFFPRKMNTAKCEAMSFPQHGNLLSSISGRTPKEYHKDLAVCDLKKKGKKGRHRQRNRTPSRQTYEVYNVDDDGDDNDD